MGIKGLLKFMKPYTESVHIQKYCGKRVGIDAYSWLHKGAYSCSMEIFLDSDGDKKLNYVKYFMHRINLLKHYGIIPVVVFDGGSIPCKSNTELERHRLRESCREQAIEKLKEGNMPAAIELFQRAINVSPQMAYRLIQVLRLENIDYIVAPYEADAQLAYFSIMDEANGGVAAVITEDSDLLAYGCRAAIFKMDKYGNGEEIVLDKVFHIQDVKPSFTHITKDLFSGMCVIAGCDFLPSVPGIGIARAYSFVSKYQDMKQVLTSLKLAKGNLMPQDYCKTFQEALAVFQHARIYDIKEKKVIHLKPLEGELLGSLDKNLEFLGPHISASIATAIAEGNLNPMTKEPFDPFLHHKVHRFLNPCDEKVLKKRKLIDGFGSSAVLNGFVTASEAVTSETKHTNEALQLQKLISTPEGSEDMEKFIPLRNRRKVPGNTFSIMRRDDEREPASSFTNEQLIKETISLNCVSESQSQEAGMWSEDSNPTRQVLKLACSSTEENLKIKVTKEPQRSLNSKAKKVDSKLKRDATILNFFSPV